MEKDAEPGTVTLNAGGAGAGEDYIWYDALAGGTILQTGGSSYVTPSISSTTNYYVTLYNTAELCESTPRTLVVATIDNGPAVTLGYAYQKTLTIDGSKVEGTNTDFPVLIHITDTDLRDKVLNNSGYDIMFSDINYTRLDHDLESYDPATGELYVWVRIPILVNGTNTQIRMFYGNPQINTDQSSDETWSSDYVQVMHLDGDFSDVTQYNNSGVNSGTTPAAGKILTARSFDGVNNIITVSDSPSLDGTNDEATFSLWINWVDAVDADYQRVMTSSNRGGDPNDGYEWATQSVSSGGGHFFYPKCDDVWANYNLGPSPFNDNTWYHLAVTLNYSTKEVKIFVNGSPMAFTTTNVPTNWTSLADIEDWWWGGGPDISDNFAGLMDEIRVQTVERTEDWLVTEFNNQNDPTGFLLSTSAESENSEYDFEVCAGESGVVYSVPDQANHSYTWTVNGGTVASGAGTHQISVNWGAAGGGDISLSINNTTTTCSANSPTYTVLKNPNPTPVINGSLTVCPNVTNEIYNTTSTLGHSYDWDVTGAVSFTGDGTDEISVDWGPGPIGSVSLIETIDATGCQATANINITIADAVPPTITCSGAQTQTADAGVCTAAVTVTGPTTGDNCGVASVTNDYNGTADASDTYPVGTTVVTWTVTDIHGNTNTCTQNITVTDDEDPTITCSGAQTQTADAGVCTAAVTVTGPTTGDNCGVASVTNDYNGTADASDTYPVGTTVVTGRDASDTYPVGTTVVTWTVTDIHGNTNTCTQNITVTDDEDPTITCSGAQTQTADAGVCTAAVTVTGPTTGDNCGVASVTNDYNGTADASDTYPVGTTVVTWTVTDIHGNTNTCTQNITVTDDEDPTITCSGAQTQTADAGVCTAAVTVTGPTTGDNCGVASVTNDYNGTADASDTYPVGTTVVTWTVTDIHGNTNTCTQNITVTDDEDPTITCSGAQTQTADAGVCTAAVTVTGPTTGDNCGVASVTNDYNGTADASDTYPVGTTVVTWTVTDIHGNTNTCTQNITVTDDEDPTITCSGAQTQTADAGVCTAAVTVTGPTTGDNCGVASVTNDYNGTADASDTYPVGTTVVTWTVTDIHGNTNTCTQNITVTDDEDPTITCSGAQTQTADAGVCTAAVTVTGPTTGDNCGVASVTNDYNGTADASDTYPVGTTVVTWTVTDIHGNTNTCTQNITVTDDEDPTITCSGAQTQTADAGVCTAAVTVTGPTTGDNCGVASVTNDYNGTADASDTYPVGTTVVTWTVTDIHGNTNTCTQNITVTDDEDPTITCSGAQTQTADAGVCTAAVTVTGPTTGDNCGVASVTNDYNGTADASDTYPVGTTVVTWTVTDIHGNTNTCTQNITVTDDEDPTITCSGAQTQTADAGVCTAAVTVTGPTTGDNCGVASVTNDYNGTADASDTYPVGTTVVTWTVTDIHGNTNTCTQNITVTDDEDPTITCSGAQTQTADAGVCTAAVTVTGPTTGDNCGVASVTNDYNGTADASDTYPVGTTVVTWTVTDIHGNTNTCTQNITVTDDEDPTITCSGAQTQTADAGACTAAVTVTGPTTGDNCGVASVTNDYNGTADASDTYPVGTTVVTWTVTDIHGNTNTCTQNITVTDDEDPTITCSGAQTQTADAGVCTAAVTVTGPTTGDNCGVASVTNDYNGTADASDTYPVGTTVVTWTVTDTHGNTNTCTQNITVTDDEDPTITCSGAQTQTADAGVCTAAVTVTGPTTGDNCGVASVTNDYNGTADASDTYPVGTTVVTWTVTDIHGNTNTCTQNITVTDDEDPTITCSGAQTQTADAGVCTAAVTVTGPTTGDNCGVASVTNDYNGTADASDTYPVGTTVVTWTVTDIHGNTNTCTQNITVTDDEDPTITCSGAQTQTADAGVCTAAVTVTGPTTGDNCGVASVTNDYNGTADASDTYPVGTTVVTWTVTDIHGNTNTCTQNITVTDDEDPTITCSGAQTQTADAGVCTAAVTVTGPTTGDNCGVASVTNDYNGTADASDTYPVGTTVVTWTVTDIHGNTNTCTQNITVTDDEDPTITCSGAQTQTADAGVCTAAVTVTGPTTGDNCGVASVTNDYNGTADASDTYPVGTTVVTWTVTDIHGNTNTCTQNITVTDDEDPTITCSGAQTQTADAGVCTAAVTVTGPTTGDNCGVASVTNDYNGTADASDTYPVGTTVVTWTVTDIHGNTNTCTQNITVTDDEDPTITCSGAQTQTADAGVCTAAVTVTGPTTGDNCGVASVTNDYNGTADASDTYPVGTTVVTWTVTDIHGNTNTCTQNITVTDDEDPTITCSGAQTQTADAGVCTAAVTVTGPTTGDNCGVASVTNDYNGTADASDTYPVGTTVVTWTVTDIHGNTNTCTQNITVTDDEDPTITCSGAQTQTADAGVCTAAVTVTGPTTGDNCGVASVTNDYNGTADASDTYPVGTTVVTWTVTDIHGNTNTCTQNITVTDDEDPTITCSGAQTQTADAGVCTAAVTVTGPTTGDNCGVASVTNDYNGTADASDTYPVGTTVVTWTVTDIHGNTNTCTQNITVTDDEDPTITCSGAQTQTADAGVCTAAVTVTGPTTGDNCGVASVTNDYNGTADASDTYPVGTTVVTWTVTDIHGNTNTCTQNIIITEDQPPIPLCRNITIQLDEATGEATITALDIDNGSTDNCGIVNWSIDIDHFTCSNIGANTVTLTVEDAAGNSAQCTSIVTVEYTTVPNPTAIPDDIVLCYDDFTGIVLNNTFDNIQFVWTVSAHSDIVGESDGSYDASGSGLPYTIAQHLTNTGTEARLVTYTITPTIYGECAYPDIVINIEINPRPRIVLTTDDVQCYDGEARFAVTDPHTLNTGTWLYDVQITYPADVTGTYGGPSEVVTLTDLTAVGASALLDDLMNSGLDAQTVEYVFTPKIDPNDGGAICGAGVSQTFNIEINPRPTIAVTTDLVLCYDDAAVFDITKLNTVNAIGEWRYDVSVVYPADVTGDWASGLTNQVLTGAGALTDNLLNSGTDVQTVVYTFTPHINPGDSDPECQNGVPVVISIEINPRPSIAVTTDLVLCYDDAAVFDITKLNTVNAIGEWRYDVSVVYPADVTGTGLQA